MIDIGSKLNGRYKIIGNIGSGGMANVYLAHDLILDREVAVKVLRFDFQNDQAAIRRFQREALAATELVHPNIVTVYDVGEDDGMQYLVMEYVKGMDLKRYIKAYYPIPYLTVVEIMQQILSAISLAHQHRIIHRDLKPQNILINEDGVVKIADFGIAIALSETSITQTNTMLGSVHYLSPEQARGSMATNQSDIYAIGIILYELLTGTVPFDGESAVTIALKHFQDEMPDIKMYDKNVPQSLENVVLHATAKDPADRYKSADEMNADLATVLSPNRLNEPKWQPHSMMDQTVALTPIDEEMLNTNAPVPEPEPVPEEPKEETPSAEPKKKKRKWWLIALIIALVAALIAGALYFAGSQGEVTVPNLAGTTEAAAREKLEQVGLKPASKVEMIQDDTVDEDRVVKTDPEYGDVVKKGSEVKIYVSSGSKKVDMKDVRDLTLEDAIAELTKLGFQESRITYTDDYSNKYEKGNVMKQTPAAGEKVAPKDTTVELVISKGVEPIKMTDYTNMTYAEAEADLTTLGIEKDQITEDEGYSNEIAAGKIMSQTPAAGKEAVPKSTQITLVVSKGPAPITMEDITGYEKSAARTYLENNGLKRKESEEYSDDVAAGRVISTDPKVGTAVNTGDTITVVYSKGPKPAEAEAVKVNFEAIYSGENNADQVVKISKTDADNPSKTQVDSFTLKPGGSRSGEITLQIKKGEKATLYFQRDDGAEQIVEVTTSDQNETIEVK